MIKINKKIIAFDLDGTLAESKQHLEGDMSELICLLAKEKIVVIITGGSFEQFKKQFLPFLKISDNDEFIVYKNLILLSTSGSQRYQYDEKSKDWIMTDIKEFPEGVKNDVIKSLNNIISSSNYDIGSVVEGDMVIEDRLTQITMSALGQHAPIELKKLWDPEQVKRQEIKRLLESELPDVSIIIGGTTSLDILPKGFDKAKGLIRLLNKLEMTKEDMIFMGDAIFPGGNDYSVYEAGIESIKVSGPIESKEIIKNWIGL
ncbi:MAG: HAD-IIB family hydrolase [Candidatus Nomurabacteria bacterium]|nr:HAD-IIB family hydrolase [Candidatus Nomurabacteria bacterium]